MSKSMLKGMLKDAAAGAAQDAADDMKASAKGKAMDKMTSGTGSVLNKITDFVSKGINFAVSSAVNGGYPIVNTIHVKYPLVLKGLYGVRIIFFMFILGVVLWSIFEDASKLSGPLYHLYSGLKSVAVILLIIAAFFVTIFGIKDEVSYKNANDISPTEIHVLFNFIKMIPYTYDLIAIVILLGILKAYYIRGTGNKDPPVWPFVDTIFWYPIYFIVGSIAFTLLSRISKIPMEIRAQLKVLTVPVLSVSFATLMIYAAITGIEMGVTDNVVYWMDEYDNDPPDMPDDWRTTAPDFSKIDGNKAKNIAISALLSIIVLVLFVVQLIPIPMMMKINENVRLAISSALTRLVNFLKKASN
ncbi:hypothetical protein PGAG_00296 [Phaeocystis globosa virus 12T]|uniref:Uncharacterized protein n=1 Tax=Phaeocystis globosa virus PgV-16T TaxID=3071227 RepID=A0AC59EXH7_9VIRU|nr:hypothetical protein PGCG_00335 [Phaeocystis globosa virus]AET73185.1 hypothetical protein PGAG_00296 [Phaeocystis globosa virus 12T]AET74009.1 hypothetical protein PGBG_00301 [Phaeocystis globosa virus 14T]AGM15646.1 hypothetical protein PGCG_00335 [Phaeocystis globosa virus PgV-16T]UYE94376.1 hypothetical protein PGV14T_00335 [Phaeocystis globosa virus]